MRFSTLSVLASLALAAVPAALAQAPALPAGSAHFALVQADNGKTDGSADCTVTPVPGGFQIDSRGQMHMGSFSYSFTISNRLDPQLNIVHDQLTGTVKGTQVTFHMASDATGRTFNVTILAAGKTTTNSFDRHQRSVLLPDLDPAAYVEMAQFALQHPPTAWIVIPKQNGILVPAEYNPDPDVTGTFHGRPITVHHTSIVVSSQNGISVEIYYTPEGELLEADLPEQNFYVIHDGFHLQNRPHYTPPRAAAPEAGAQQPGQNGVPPQGQYPPPQGQYPPPQNQYPQPQNQ